MKVLVLAPPMGGVGGVQQYTATLARALCSILREENVRLEAVPAEPDARGDGTIALRRGVKLKFLARAIGDAIRWRPELIICTHLGVAPAALRVKSLFGIPYWIVLHGIEVWGDLPPGKIRALQRAQRLIANSKFTLEAAISRHELTGKLTSILPPAFEKAQDGNKTAGAKISPQKGNRQPTVLTVGRLAASERYKGHDVMLEAWVELHRKTPNAKYVIVGDGDDRKRLEERTRELGIAESVKFMGAISGAALAKQYEECDVFALPARTDLDSNPPRGEGFGIVFLEAMSHGKPVVGPKCGAPAEFIRDGVDGVLVDPTKPQEVAGALIELLQQPEWAQQMGEAAREWVEKEYSFEKFRERLKVVLRPPQIPIKKP